MMRRNAAVAGPILPYADPDSISESGSSTSVPSPPPQPRRRQAQPVLQVARAAGAPVADEEVTSQLRMVEGSATSVVAGAALNKYLRSCGQIPMICTQVPDVDLNAPPPPDRPVICAYCNSAFCFGDDEAASLDLGPGHVYPAPAEPITLNLFTPPAVWPLNRPDPWGPGGAPEWLLVCSCKHHFKATMGMLQQQQPGGAPSLEWRCIVCCLRVLPIVVGSEGSNSPDLYGSPAPPLEPCRYAGAYWNYVELGDEDLVKLKLHDDDPLSLRLTLGRP